MRVRLGAEGGVGTLKMMRRRVYQTVQLPPELTVRGHAVPLSRLT